MKKCPNCSCLWPDEYNGSCHECGAGLGSVQPDGGLQFRYAKQLGDMEREASLGQQFRSSRGSARPGDAYDRAPVNDAVIEKARAMLLQREELRYEEDDGA